MKTFEDEPCIGRMMTKTNEEEPCAGRLLKKCRSGVFERIPGKIIRNK